MARSADPSIAEIVDIASHCDDLAAVAKACGECTLCPELASRRTTVVVGDFPANPRFLIVGEAPGATEDLAGRPFIGKAGALLDALLLEAGVSRADVAVANVCNCRPPDNRTPSTAEARRCAGWLDRQIQLLDPSLVVALGRTALTWAIGASSKLADVRGTAHDWRDRRLVVSYHPSAAIRFGPNGAPMAALRADLAFAASLA